MANNWHSPPNPGYAHHPGYPPHQQQQHHYGPSQHSYQPHHHFGPPTASSPPLGYSPPVPYQQSQSQPITPRGPPPVAHSSQNTCYNCGSPDHWAQHCPEPRREVPVGDIQRQNSQYNQQPFKRPRHNYNQGYVPPVITKYQVPHQAQSPYAGPQPYSGPGYGQPPPVHQGPSTPAHYGPPTPTQYGPPTPVTGFSSPRNQWSPPPNARFQQPYSPGGGYGPQSHSVPPLPGGNGYYGPNHHSPVSDHRAHHGPIHPPYGPFHSGHGPQYSSHATPSHFTNNEPLLNRHEQSSFPANQSVRSMSHGSPALVRSASMHSQATVPTQSSNRRDDQLEEDDLDLLDIPDCPKYPGPNDERGAQPADVPLPAELGEFESAGGVLPAPTFETGGMIQSAYVSSETFEELRKNIRNSRKWTCDVDDPIFNYVYDDSKNVPFEEWTQRSRHRSRRFSDADGEEGELREDIQVDEHNSREEERYRRDSEKVEMDHDSDESSRYYKSSFEPNKRSHNQTTQAHGLQITERHDEPQVTNRQEKPRDTEEILAALGVTGIPKPPKAGRGPARTYLPAEFCAESTKDTSASVSNSMSESPVHWEKNTSPAPTGRSNNGGSSRHDPFDPDDRSSDGDHQAISNGQSKPEQATTRHEPSSPALPPVEPVVARRTSNFNGTAEGITAPQSAKPCENGHQMPNGGYRNDYNGYSMDGASKPLLKLHSEKSYDRKREFDDRDSSDDEKGNERRRQADDVTPKLKRRQPKVAAAYSRRW